MIILIIFSACLDNFNRDPETIYYNPSYSLPIGPLSYTLDDIMPDVALHEPVPDTTILPDTADVPIIVYDDSLLFVNPEEGHDTAFFEPFLLTSYVEQTEYIVSIMFRANVSNGLPVNTEIQLYYLDAAGTAIDSLYDEGPVQIERALLNDRDSVLAPYFTTIDTYLDDNEIQNLIQTNQIGLFIHLETYRTEDDTLYVYSYQQFDVQLGVRVELMIPIE
jgi:hypothetical protein